MSNDKSASRREQSQSKRINSRQCCLDKLMESAAEYNRGRLILNDDEYSRLISLLENHASRCLAPGDQLRLDGVTLVRNLDGTAAVEMRIPRCLSHVKD
jgi:hypothetical protein